MDQICLLIEAAAVEICTLYIVRNWIQLTGCGRPKPKTPHCGVRHDGADVINREIATD